MVMPGQARNAFILDQHWKDDSASKRNANTFSDSKVNYQPNVHLSDITDTRAWTLFQLELKLLSQIIIIIYFRKPCPFIKDQLPPAILTFHSSHYEMNCVLFRPSGQETMSEVVKETLHPSFLSSGPWPRLLAEVHSYTTWEALYEYSL